MPLWVQSLSFTVVLSYYIIDFNFDVGICCELQGPMPSARGRCFRGTHSESVTYSDVCTHPMVLVSSFMGSFMYIEPVCYTDIILVI